MHTGIQLYTLRDLDETLPKTIETVGETSLEGVEFADLGDSPPSDVSAALDTSGLAVAGAHVGLAAFEEDYEGTVATYDALGCDALVIPAYEHEAFESAESARNAGRRLAELAERLDSDGVTLHYHNHTFEFTDVGDETAFDVFVRSADGVNLEIDTGLAHHAGVDPVDLLERYGDRVSLVHLTDSKRGSRDTVHMDLGMGDVALQECVDACGDVGVDWILFEHGLTDEPIASMEDAAEVMETLR